ncbi:nucleoside triphosphate pyrophosphatase [Marinoscillum sp. MHG1-6]|uniref:Maf family protein n=1 Tax=Marinoscillum sp. MHG1-6 TaxID=2959627 RepID=UPI0021589AFF|nr:Maf family protein [Marinoscillum sp. MHG1-6]
MNSMHHLILASNSPRRKELLQKAGYQFQVVTYDLEEHFDDRMPAHQVAEFLAIEKNAFYRKKLENQVVITADTTVVMGDTVFNKPKDMLEALEMLRSFSGKTHQVITGICVSSLKKVKSLSVITEVTFSDMSKSEMEHYICEYQPMDKAGSYGIQEWIGLTKIDKINGSYTNVVGLPMKELYDLLKYDFGISPLD